MHRYPKYGLTLIEILIIISLVGVLALLTSSIYIGSNIQKGRDAKRKTDLAILTNTIEEYYSSVGCYPDSLVSCNQKFSYGSDVFMSAMLCDPKTGINYTYVNDNLTCPQLFTIYTNLEYKKDPRIDEVGCTYGCGPDCLYNYGVASPNTTLIKCTPSVTPTPTPVQYVCAPGGGQEGHCEAFEDPALSECPKIYPDDPTCNNECNIPANRCKNSSGKYKP